MNNKIKTVGLTGGIGSGKSTIAAMFSELSVAVYVADIEAKKLMVENIELKQEITNLLGERAYANDVLNRAYIAKKVFQDAHLLEALNALVHPAVAKHFDAWKSSQKGTYVIKEVAILFENKGEKKCDFTILVTAPISIRIERVLKRDKITKEQILSRMQHQWSDEQKIPLADYVIDNLNLNDSKKAVKDLHKKLISLD